jgi:Transmembrane protein of unknown function (DUF3556)
MQKDQLQLKLPLLGAYDERVAEVVMNRILAWRSMHSQGRGLNAVMMNHLGEDIGAYTLREAEFSCNAIVGFNFGDGHLHDQNLIKAIQRRCKFARASSTSSGSSPGRSSAAARATGSWTRPSASSSAAAGP